MSELSVIIPTHNDEIIIQKTLEILTRLVNVDEIIIVDGSSTDRTVEIIESFSDRLGKLILVKTNEVNRAKRFEEGVRQANGSILWFLLPEMHPKQGTARRIKTAMKYQGIVGGSFEMAFEANKNWTRFLAKIFGKLAFSTLFCLDSSVFVSRRVYEEIGGFRLSSFEIQDLKKRLSKCGDFIFLTGYPITFCFVKMEQQSIFSVLFRLVACQMLHLIGLPPSVIARILG